MAPIASGTPCIRVLPIVRMQFVEVTQLVRFNGAPEVNEMIDDSVQPSTARWTKAGAPAKNAFPGPNGSSHVAWALTACVRSKLNRLLLRDRFRGSSMIVASRR